MQAVIVHETKMFFMYRILRVYFVLLRALITILSSSQELTINFQVMQEIFCMRISFLFLYN